MDRQSQLYFYFQKVLRASIFFYKGVIRHGLKIVREKPTLYTNKQKFVARFELSENVVVI
jgi:hypothetical protein